MTPPSSRRIEAQKAIALVPSFHVLAAAATFLFIAAMVLNLV